MNQDVVSADAVFRRLCAACFFSVFGLCGVSSYVLGYNIPFPELLLQFLLMPFVIAVSLVIGSIPAGYVADHFSKRTGILFGLFGELVVIAFLGLFFSHGLEETNTVVVVGIMGIFASFTYPSLNSLLPELFSEKELSGRDSRITFWCIAGMAAGLTCSCVMLYGPDKAISWRMSFLLYGLFSLTGFLIAHHLPLICPQQEVNSTKGNVFRNGLSEILRKEALFYASLGHLLIIVFCFTLPILLLSWYQDQPGVGCIKKGSEIILIQAAPILGMILGAWLAGFLSRQKIEMGLLPFGTAGIAVGFMLTICCPGNSLDDEIRESLGWLGNYLPNACLLALLWLFIGGIGAGFLLIPLKSYCQLRYRAGCRGSALAVKQIFLGILLLLIAGCYLILAEFDCISGIKASYLIAGFSITAVILTLLSMWFLPDMILRFLTITLGRAIYRVQVRGAENIPEQGPALLVSNHVSLIDSILISACTSRRVRFLMTEDFLKRPFIRWIARLTGFIVVPNPDCGIKKLITMVQTVRDALSRGEIICVFPEGEPTENGILRPFKQGFTHMLPKDIQVPLIPLSIGGMWGSRFSRSKNIVGHAIPLRTKQFATVCFGKAMQRTSSAFQIRQEISKMRAESGEQLPFPSEKPLHVILAEHAKRHPCKTLITDADGKTFSTFKTFLSALLLSREMRKWKEESEYVGILLPNCTASALSLLALLYADKIPCSLNFTTPQETFDKTIQKAGIQKIITSRKFLEKIRLKPAEEKCIFIEDLVRQITPGKKIIMLLAVLLMPVRELLSIVSPRSCSDCFRTATVLFSSGTTGDPKGVCLTHHNFYSDVLGLSQVVAFNPALDGFLGNLPLFHSFGLTVCFWIPVLTGCRTTFMPNPLDGAMAGKLIERDKLTMLFATPTFLQTYMKKWTPEQIASLRFAVTGAERLRPEIATHFCEMTNARLVITEGYGCTELSPVVSVNIPDNNADLGGHLGKEGSIGPAIPEISAKIVDPITFKELPPESEGLLFVRGPIVMLKYLNDPERTEKTMMNGYYNTGDIATMHEDGRIFICGRLSRFSKISGEMVPHEMVENIINELCKAPVQVAAVGSIPDARKGEALAVLYTPDMSMTPTEIVNELRERSISNLWIPKVVNFYEIDALPKLGSGKLDLMKLKQILEEKSRTNG